MPGLDDPYAQPIDIYGAPDPASLRWPWDPPLDPTPAAPPPAPAADQSAPQLQQPGLGLPTQAVDAAAPQLGPPIEADAPPAPAPPLPDIAPEQLFAPGIPAAPDTGPPPMYGPPISPAEQHYQQSVADHAGQPLAIQDHAEQARAIGSLDAVGFAQLDAQHERDRAAFVEQRRRAATDAYIAGEKQALADRQIANRHAQERSDALIADATRIANTKVDPSGGVHGPRLIAGVLASIVGGLVQGRTGSAHNAGLDALMQTINNGIEAQKADLANQREGIGLRRGALADEYARTGHLQDAEDRVRLSSLKLADDMLASDAQNWDPRGTTAINNERLRRGINGQMAAVVDGQRQRDLENSLKISKERREAELAANTIRHDRASEYLQSRTLVSAAADRKAAADARREEKAAEAADKAAERRRQFAIGATPVVQTDADNKPVIGTDGKPVLQYGDLTNADGSVWEAESPEAVRELRKKKTAAASSIAINDEIRAIRNRVGGESKLLNSKDAQRLEVLQAQSRLITKDGTEGMSSDEDGKILSTAAGTGDATSWRDQEAKLLEARALTEANLNRAFADAKYTGRRISFPEAKPTTNTADEDATQALLTAPNTSLDEEVRKEIDVRQRAAGRGGALGALDITNNPEDQALYHGAYEAVRAEYDPNASRDQQRKIAELGAAAAGTSPESLAAAAKLQQVATTAETSRLRDLARRALQAAQLARTPGEPAAPGRDVGVSYETVPPAPRGGR